MTMLSARAKAFSSPRTSRRASDSSKRRSRGSSHRTPLRGKASSSLHSRQFQMKCTAPIRIFCPYLICISHCPGLVLGEDKCFFLTLSASEACVWRPQTTNREDITASSGQNTEKNPSFKVPISWHVPCRNSSIERYMSPPQMYDHTQKAPLADWCFPTRNQTRSECHSENSCIGR